MRGGQRTDVTQAQAQEELSFALQNLETSGAVAPGWADQVLETIGDQAPSLLDENQVQRIIQREGIARMVREKEPWATLPNTLAGDSAGANPMSYVGDYIPEVEFTRGMSAITKGGLLIIGTAGGGYIAYRLNGGKDPMMENYKRNNPPAPIFDQPSAPSRKPERFNALAL